MVPVPALTGAVNRAIIPAGMLASCLLFILLALRVGMNEPFACDIELLRYFAGHATPAWTSLFRYLAWAGSITVLGPSALLSGYLLYVRGRKADAVVVPGAFAIAALAVRVLKVIVDRERPDVSAALVDTFSQLSFPSGHAAQVTAFCLALFLVWRPASLARRVLLGGALLVVVLVVSISRLYLQVHYPSDILGGALLGCFCVLATVQWQGRRRVVNSA